MYIYHSPRMQGGIRKKSSNPSENDFNQPLPFTKSSAARWSARNSYSGGKEGVPWYQPLSISISVTAILVWFCILREENDVDVKLGKSLYEHVDGLEKKQLELFLEHNQGSSAEREAAWKRLKELNKS